MNKRTITGIVILGILAVGAVALVPALAEDDGKNKNDSECTKACCEGEKVAKKCGAGSCGDGECDKGKAVAKANCPSGACKGKASCGGGKCAEHKAQCGTKCKETQAMAAEQLAVAVKRLEDAGKAIEAGDKKTALAAVADVKKIVGQMHAMVTANSRPAIANRKCPIMMVSIDPDKVPENLYRVHKGKGVGFCCAGCPSAWDKLTDEQKTLKLQAMARK